MHKHEFREKVIHGTPDFPLETYHGQADQKNQIISPLHFHKEFEFCIATAGKIVIQINENRLELKKGEGVFITAETLHAISTAEDAKGGFTALLFDAGIIAGETDIIRHRFITPLIHGEISVSENLTPEEVLLVSNTVNAYHRKDYGYELVVKYNITKLLFLLIQSAQVRVQESANPKREIIKKTIDYIHKNYREPISLAELAAQVYVTPEYLCRIFAQISDVPPFEYLNRYRIMQSTTLLLRNNAPIAEISSACGFNSSSYFNKLFRRFVGCTPTAYRQKNQR